MKRTLTRLLTVIGVIAASGCVSGQGQKFAVVFPIIDGGDTTGNCDLYLTTAEDFATVKVTSAQTDEAIYQISRDSGQRVDLSPDLFRATDSGLVEQRGLLINSDKNINVHGLNGVTSSADGFQSVPLSPDATEFVLASSSPLFTRASQFFIAASEGGTDVNITLPGSASSSSVTLQQFETWGIQSFEMDLTGTKVTSNKPIAVYSGHECGQIPDGVQFCDQLIIGVPPVNQLGTQFVAPPIGGRPSGTGFVVRVIGAQDNTLVTVTDYGGYALNTGQSITINTQNTAVPVAITCSLGCLVVQYNKGGKADDYGTDPFSSVVTPVERYANRLTWITPRRGISGTFVNYVSIVSPTDATSGVRLDGTDLKTQWTPVPGLELSTAYVEVTDGQHTVYHVDPGVSLMVAPHGHGGSTEESYAFPAGVADSAATTTPVSTISVPATSTPTTDRPTTRQTTSAPTTVTSIMPTQPQSTTPIPNDVYPPLQYISINGSLEAPTEITENCRTLYVDSFFQRASNVVEKLSLALNQGMCSYFPLGAALILEYNVNITISANDATKGELTFTVVKPAVYSNPFSENHACGREISAFMRDHKNYLQPILPPVAGCPALSLTQPDYFDDYHRQWVCYVISG